MRIHILQHVPFEGPASILNWARNKKAELTTSKLYEANVELPPPSQIDLLIVMGGPMSVYDEDAHPWLKREKAYLKDYIASGRKMIGICLGAQLAADALGARVYPNEQREIGWHSVYKTGEVHPLYKHMPETCTVLHWHGDTFDLPEGAVHLARSDATANQAFIWDDRVLGLQYHLEFLSEDIERLISHGKDYLEDSTGPYVQSAPMIRNGLWHCSVCTGLLGTMLDRFMAVPAKPAQASSAHAPYSDRSSF